MAAHVGEEPEPVEAEGDEFQSGAAPDQMEEFAAAAGKRHRHRWRDGRRQRRRHLRGPAHLVHRSTSTPARFCPSNHKFVGHCVTQAPHVERFRARWTTRIQSFNSDLGRVPINAQIGCPFPEVKRQHLLSVSISACDRYCCKSLLGWRSKIPKAADALHARRGKGPYRFIQNRSRVSVKALKSDAAIESSEDQLWRNFLACSILDF